MWAGASRLTSITSLLFAVAILDELASGVPSAGSPEIERGFALSHTATAIALFLVPGVAGMIVDPFVFLLADRYSRRWFLAGGLGVMGLGALGAALAPGPVTLAIALACWFVASGAAVSLAQGTLVDRAPDARARTMTRWTLCSLAGDLLAPVSLAVLGAAGLGWRAGFVLVGGLLVTCAAVVARRGREIGGRGGARDDEDEPRAPLGQAFRVALRDRVLLLWLFGMALCDLLDEILVVFASLHVRDDLGASLAWQSAILGACMLGGAAGLVAVDRLLARRHDERALLVAFGLACGASFAAWLVAPTPLWSALGMLLVGATSAPLYPLAAARAYARCPGRSGVVLAVSHLFTPLGLALPLVLGIVADRLGTPVALALLVIQPLGLAALARAAP